MSRTETTPVGRADNGARPLTPRATVALTAAGASLIAACYGLARFAYGLFLPAFREAFALDAATAGLIASASYTAYCVGILAATALTPRVGARPVAVTAGALATAGCAMIAATPSALVLGVGVAVAGSSTGVASPPLARAVSEHVTAARQDRVQTLVNAGTGVGVMVSGPVALLTQEQWRTGWWIFTALAALVTLWIWRTVPAGRQGAARAKAESAQADGRPPLFPPGAWALVTASAVMGASSAAGWTFGQDFLQTAGGHGPGLATAAWIVLGACGLAGAAAGDLVGRMSLPTAWTGLMAVFAAATAAWALWPQDPVVAVAASGAFGAIYIALTGVLLLWGTRLYPGRASTGVGLAFLAIAAGQAAASPALGALAGAADMRLAFLIAAGAGVAGAMLRPSRAHTRT